MKFVEDFRKEVDYVLQEEERKNQRLQRRRQTAARRSSYMNRHNPTYLAVLTAKIMTKIGLVKPAAPVDGAGTENKKIKDEVTLLTIVGEDLARFRYWLFNGNHKDPKMKSKDSWEDWKEYFEKDAPINVPPRYEPPPEPEKVFAEYPEYPSSKPDVSPEVEAFFEDCETCTFPEHPVPEDKV